MIKHFYSFAMLYRKKKKPNVLFDSKGLLTQQNRHQYLPIEILNENTNLKTKKQKKIKKYKIIVQEFIVRKSERIQIRG